MKNLITIFALALFTLPLFAQDMIILKNGDMIEAKVLELQIQDIKYKRFNHLDGPTITISKADVFLIKYENGTKEVITAIQEKEPIHQEQQAPTNWNETPYKPAHQKRKPKKAPFERTNNYSMYAGIAIPLGFEYSSLVNTGFHAGFENTTMYTPNIGLTGHLLVAVNRIDVGDGYNGGIINAFGMSGCRFQTDSGNVQIFGLALIGVDWAILTGDFSDIGNGINLAAGGGFGLIFSETVEVGLRLNHGFTTTGNTQLQLSAGLYF